MLKAIAGKVNNAKSADAPEIKIARMSIVDLFIYFYEGKEFCKC